MRIAWFTPLAQRSSIGRFSSAIATALSRSIEVDLCHFDRGDLRDTSVRTIAFASAQDVSLQMLSDYDLVVYNFGNYLPFHGEIYELSRTWPGVCVLHDFVMHHFFAEYFLARQRDTEGYQTLLKRIYGPDAPGRSAKVWETDDALRYPLFEEAALGALGVITHSEFFRSHVQQCFAGPVACIPLAHAVSPKGRDESRRELGIDNNQTLLLTIGHVNPNKQIECVLNALNRIDKRDLIYVILGAHAVDYVRKLQSLVDTHHLGRVVRFLGEVSDEVLCTYLSAADICINLRFPTMEGASGSVVEEMLFGKPVVVTNTGFFGELPDDSVVKVRHSNDSDVEAALRRLLGDADARRAIAARAKTFAEAEFHPDAYAKRAIDFLWDVRSTRPILDLTDRVALELGRMGVHADMGIVDAVAREIGNTLVGSHSEPYTRQTEPKQRQSMEDPRTRSL